jgi:hypothetical protein
MDATTKPACVYAVIRPRELTGNVELTTAKEHCPMYSVIEESRELIVNSLSAAEIHEYEVLRNDLVQLGTAAYQNRYKNFWSMNVARLSRTFTAAYFGALNSTAPQTVSLRDVCQTLWSASARRNGTRTLQFSFATKLVHMLQPQLPIYDSRVAWFYFFSEPPTSLPVTARIDRFIGFHSFLTNEYARIIDCGLLSKDLIASNVVARAEQAAVSRVRQGGYIPRL